MVKKKDLKKDGVLSCCCGAEYSANPADYFYLSDEAELKCPCGEELLLVKKKIVYEPY